MKKLLFLLLLAVPTLAQTNQVSRVDFSVYEGNPFESPALPLASADVFQKPTVVYTFTSLPNSLTVSSQPTVIREGLALKVRFAQTLGLPKQGWYEVKLAGITRYSGNVNVSKTTTNVRPGWLADNVFYDLFSQLLLYLY